MTDRRSPLLLLSLLLALLTAVPARAHKPSDTYLRINAGDRGIAIEWDIALRDLEMLVGLDANSDGDITWGEVKAKRRAISDYALQRLTLSADGSPCALTVTDLLINRHSDGAYAVLVIEVDGPPNAESLTIDYDLLFDLDPTHRGLVMFSRGGVTSTYILSPDRRIAEIKGDETGYGRALKNYITEGVWHIWIGVDHVLFLVCLLLPAVWRWDKKGWQPVERFRPSLNAVLKIVTMFTIAHTITLWLAVMRYIELPSRPVEAAIALSIIITALHNLFPRVPVPGWAIAFGFGLVHGFGFAGVLTDLGLSSTSLAVPLLGFNVGVELGQMAIVVAFMPVAFKLRDSGFYKWAVFRGGSAVVGLIAAAWFYERAFNADLGLPF